MIKLVFYGLSGSGKSTSAHVALDYYQTLGLQVEMAKLAQPLYELQQKFYRVAGKQIGFYEQDQVLLEAIATQLRRISPTSLVDDLMRRLSSLKADVVINDDLRDPHVDYPFLKEQGFKFIRIWCNEEVRLQRLRQRRHLSVVMQSASTAEIDRIVPDVVIDNSAGSLDELRSRIYDVLERLP